MEESPSRSRRRVLRLGGLALATGVAGCLGGGGGSSTPSSTPSPARTPAPTPNDTPTQTPGASLSAVRSAIEPYRDVGTALADGYRSTREYVVEEHGAMGIHFVNPARMQGPPDPMAPPVLMYDLTPDGQYELLGVEWFVPADAVPEAPTLFGRTFHGPMAGHNANQPRHYELHAWLFRENPEGTFAQVNPQVSPPSFAETVRSARETLAPYTDVSKAEGDGFVPEGECVESNAGGMGVHYFNPQRMQGPPDPMAPPILTYSERDDGSMRLTGAEWFVPAEAVSETPTLFGQAFDGPMEGHGPNQPRHYDLHAWLFRTNPEGMFVPYNPTVTCQ